MTATSRQQIGERNGKALREILRTLERGQGSFTVIFARANYQEVRDRSIAHLLERSPLLLHQVELPPDTVSIYPVIRRGWEQALMDHPEGVGGLLVQGLENLADVAGAIAAANLMRDEFLRTLQCPLVFWVNDEVLKLFLRQGKDFASYATTKRFEIDPQSLTQSLEQSVGHAFEHVMATGAGRFWTVASPQYRELAAGRSELRVAGITLDPALDASIEFFLAQDPSLELAAARERYEHCLTLWEQVDAPEREGCTWFYLNLWWRQFAAQNRSQYGDAYREARHCCERALVCFETAKRLDLVSRFINGLEAVLYRLAALEGEASGLWDVLQEVAERGFSLHEAENNRLRQSYDLGSMAMVALGKHQWAIAYDRSQSALGLYLEATGRPSRGQRRPWPEFDPQLYEYHEALMRYLVGRSLAGLGKRSAAIAELETARQVGKADYEPELYIDLLKTLSRLYFAQKDYRRAYGLKQDYQATEAEYGFRPFTGARSLRPIRRAANPAWNHSDISLPNSEVDPRNLAVGREQDVEALVARLSLPQYRLIVVHGESGVGKSSLMKAGLVPRLQGSSMDAKVFVPVLLRRYGNWARDLGVQLFRGIAQYAPIGIGEVPVTAADILKLLEGNRDRNVVTVLIFDQFEEFFFSEMTLTEGVGVREKSFKENRKYLYDFIAQCLELLDVKVVLSLREDYLHYLLELDRVSNLSAIDRDILRRDIRYPLEDFSPERAKQVIADLTRRSQFNLSSALIDRLVADLATDFGEVRPIELQVVGAQLQTDNIMELDSYHQLGPDPKKILVAQSLDEVVSDCGPEQSKLTGLVLGLLTSDNSIRPLKTRVELEQELVQIGYFKDDELDPNHHASLDLVLDILVASGLVFFVPDEPIHCYQLVHDYLVQLIREHQGSAIDQLRENLNRERLLRRRKELQLTRVLKQRLRLAIAVGVALGGLLGLSSYFAYSNWQMVSDERYLVESLQLENQAQQQQSAIATGPQPEGLSPPSSPSGAEETPPPESAAVPDPVTQSPSIFENLAKLLSQTPENASPQLAAQANVAHATILAQYLDPLVRSPNLPGEGIQQLAWQPGSDHFAVIDGTGQVHRYDRAGIRFQTLETAELREALQLIWDPQGEILITRHRSGELAWWDSTGRRLKTLLLPVPIEADTMLAWTWHPQGTHLAIAHPYQPALWFWERQGQEPMTLALPAITRSIAWQPLPPEAENQSSKLAMGLDNGSIITTTDRESIDDKVWWYTGNRRVQPITAIAWQDQGQRLVSLGAMVLLWSPDGDLLHNADWPDTLPQDNQNLAAGVQNQRILHWQPQGNLLALLAQSSGDRPPQLGLWTLDPQNNTLAWIRKIAPFQDSLSAMTWSQTEASLLTGDRTGTIRQWPLQQSAQRKILCRKTPYCPSSR